MAFTPIELIVVAVILVVVVLWGPKKIPELARALGRAKKEFSEGTKDPVAGSSAAGTPSPSAPTGDTLLDTAKRLGLSTEGKTRDQISEEIVKKAQGNA